MGIQVYTVNAAQALTFLGAADMPETDRAHLVMASHNSTLLLTAFEGDTQIGLLGLIPVTLMSDTAYVWLYTTPDVAARPVSFGRLSRGVLQNLLTIYPHLIGFCTTRNAANWITWLGGHLLPPRLNVTPFEIRSAR